MAVETIKFISADREDTVVERTADPDKPSWAPFYAYAFGQNDGLLQPAYFHCQESYFGVSIYSNGERFDKTDDVMTSEGYEPPNGRRAYPLGWS